MAGLLCANALHSAGVDYVLLEACGICGGITADTTAKLSFQHGLIYDRLIREKGISMAKLYLAANQKALEKYFEMCRDIDCDFEEKNSYIYSLDDREKIIKEAAAFHTLGFHAELEDKLPLPFPVAGAVKVSRQAQFNPLKFASAIAEKLHVYEHSRVYDIKKGSAFCSGGRINAKKIIAATHFPFINRRGLYFLKLYQSRSYVAAAENAAQVDGMYLDENENGMSFRNYKNFLLLGALSHRTGKKSEAWKGLIDFSLRAFPDSPVKYRWAAQDCMTPDGIPYIGRYSPNTENLFVATGFNKWGMTASMLSAQILFDMVTGKENQYAGLFSPSRKSSLLPLAANAFEAAVSLLTPTLKRCPHMGCALKWNPAEHSWDCPCHGSRFTQKGRLIDTPAQKSMKNMDI